jgi:hypothetical protein
VTHWTQSVDYLMANSIPDARLEADGSVVSMLEGIPLPNFSGPVYALLAAKHSYVLWLYPVSGDGQRRWDVINPGSTIVQSALDQFIKEHTDV